MKYCVEANLKFDINVEADSEEEAMRKVEDEVYENGRYLEMSPFDCYYKWYFRIKDE